MKKKLLTIALSFTLAASMTLTGCGGSEKSNGSTSAVPEATKEETTTELKLEGEDVAPSIATAQNVIDDNNRNFYEIFVGSFYDSDGDGMGDLQGVIQKLDYINDGDPNTTTDLGCNGIWLMPISESPTYHKYDVVDYYSVDDAYGTVDDFKQLAAACEERGITLIVDLVMNHSSLANPWFREMKAYLENLPEGKEPSEEECKYVGYYNIKKDNTMGDYYKVGTSDYYYEAMFSSNMPDLRLDNPNVRAEFEAIAKYWLEDMGADGFRLDAAKEYFSGETQKNVEVLTWFNNYVRSVKPDAYIVAETWTGDYNAYYASGIDGAFDFSFAGNEGLIALTSHGNGGSYSGANYAGSMVKAMDLLDDYTTTGSMAMFVGNHDLNRCTHYLGFKAEKTKFAHGLLSILNGSIFIYYGDEIGLGGVEADENKRSPMIWSATDKTGECAGPMNMDASMVINRFEPVEDQQKDPNSILNYVKEAVRLRNVFPEIARGTIEIVSEVTDENICAVKKTYNGSSIIILANCSGKKQAVANVPRSVYGYTCIQGMLTTGEEQPKQVGDNIVLPPYSIVILK